MSLQTPTVAVIIPNWNGKELLESVSLPSLATQTYIGFSVTVVDNGSTDGSVEFLRSAHPEVGVIEVGYNSGFAAAVNRGIAASEATLVALLNNDVELDPGWIEAMVAAAVAIPSAGSFACRIMDFEDRTLITTVGDCVGPAGQIFWRGWKEQDVGQYSHAAPVFSACAGAALYRRSALVDVGPFDEDFFAYLEDVDWGFRARLAGYSCCFVPEAVAYHLGGVTSARVSGFRYGLLARNAYWLVLKNFSRSHMARHAPALAFMTARRFYRVFRDGHRRRALAAALDAVRLTPLMMRKRRLIQSQRRVDDRELALVLANDASLGSAKVERLKCLVPAWRRGRRTA